MLRDHLRAFPDVELDPGDYEEAASFFNRCRARGVQGSNTDFLICAAAARRQLGILTTDADFRHFAKLLPIRLHAPRATSAGSSRPTLASQRRPLRSFELCRCATS